MSLMNIEEGKGMITVLVILALIKWERINKCPGIFVVTAVLSLMAAIVGDSYLLYLGGKSW